MKTYEGMFLLDAGQPNFDEAVAPIRAIFDRYGVEVLQMKKWDERRLAYEIAGRRRGLYVLTYFRAEPDRISPMEHDVQLNEKILRVLITSADHVSQEQMNAPVPAEMEPSRREDDEEHGDRGDRGDRDDRRRGRRFRDEQENRDDREPRGRRERESAEDEGKGSDEASEE